MFHSGYWKFYLNSPKGYSRKIINAQTAWYCIIFHYFSRATYSEVVVDSLWEEEVCVEGLVEVDVGPVDREPGLKVDELRAEQVSLDRDATLCRGHFSTPISNLHLELQDIW